MLNIIEVTFDCNRDRDFIHIIDKVHHIHDFASTQNELLFLNDNNPNKDNLTPRSQYHYK